MTFYPSLADHIIFALLAFVLPVFAVWFVKPQAGSIPQETALKVRLYIANSAVLWLGALVIIVLWLITGRDFELMGVRWPDISSKAEWAILAMFFLLVYMFDSFVAWFEDDEDDNLTLLPANTREFSYFAGVVSVSAAVCEEIVFRGFLVTYILSITADTGWANLLAIVGSSVVFGIVHAYQGWLALAKITVLSALFAAIFIVSKSLLLVIALHFLVDFLGGYMALSKSVSTS